MQYKSPSEQTDDELLAEIRERYEPTEVPPCRVCGEALSLQQCGGGEPSVWACAGHTYGEDGRITGRRPGRRIADQHFSDSEVVDYRRGGDEAVMELVKRFSKTQPKEQEIVEKQPDEEEGATKAAAPATWNGWDPPEDLQFGWDRGQRTQDGDDS